MGNSFLILAIILYLLMGITMYILGYAVYQQSQNTVMQQGNAIRMNVYFMLSILFFAVVCGIRYRVGKDCESYVESFEYFKTGIHYSDDSQFDEPLYTLFLRLLTSIGAGRVLFLGWLAFLEIVFFYSALRSRSFLFPFIGLALMMGFHFQEWNNGLRQMIASCIFVYAVVGLIDNNKKFFWKYFVWIFLAFTIHKSSVLLLPLVFLLFYNKKPQPWLSLGLLFAAFVVGRSPLPETMFSGVDEMLSMIGYENYSDRLDYYLSLESKVQHYGPRRITLFLTYVLIAINGTKMDEYYGRDRFYRVSYLLFMAYACFTELLLSMRGIFSRPFLFFMPFFLIMSGYLLYYLKMRKNRVMFWLVVVLICSYSILSCLAEYSSPTENVVYKLVFFHP